MERSLLYCMRHPIAPEADTPEHMRPLFSPTLLAAWKQVYCLRPASALPAPPIAAAAPAADSQVSWFFFASALYRSIVRKFQEELQN